MLEVNPRLNLAALAITRAELSKSDTAWQLNDIQRTRFSLAFKDTCALASTLVVDTVEDISEKPTATQWTKVKVGVGQIMNSRLPRMSETVCHQASL